MCFLSELLMLIAMFACLLLSTHMKHLPPFLSPRQWSHCLYRLIFLLTSLLWNYFGRHQPKTEACTNSLESMVTSRVCPMRYKIFISSTFCVICLLNRVSTHACAVKIIMLCYTSCPMHDLHECTPSKKQVHDITSQKQAGVGGWCINQVHGGASEG